MRIGLPILLGLSTKPRRVRRWRNSRLDRLPEPMTLRAKRRGNGNALTRLKRASQRRARDTALGIGLNRRIGLSPARLPRFGTGGIKSTRANTAVPRATRVSVEYTT